MRRWACLILAAGAAAAPAGLRRSSGGAPEAAARGRDRRGDGAGDDDAPPGARGPRGAALRPRPARAPRELRRADLAQVGRRLGHRPRLRPEHDVPALGDGLRRAPHARCAGRSPTPCASRASATAATPAPSAGRRSRPPSRPTAATPTCPTTRCTARASAPRARTSARRPRATTAASSTASPSTRLKIDAAYRVGAVPKVVATTPRRALRAGQQLVLLRPQRHLDAPRARGAPRPDRRLPARDRRVADQARRLRRRDGRQRGRARRPRRTGRPGAWRSAPARAPCRSGRRGRYLFATLNAEGTVARLDLRTGAVAKARTGSAPRSMDIAPDGRSLYVVNYESGTVSKLRASDMSVLQTVDACFHPIGITYEPRHPAGLGRLLHRLGAGLRRPMRRGLARGLAVAVAAGALRPGACATWHDARSCQLARRPRPRARPPTRRPGPAARVGAGEAGDDPGQLGAAGGRSGAARRELRGWRTAMPRAPGDHAPGGRARRSAPAGGWRRWRSWASATTRSGSGGGATTRAWAERFDRQARALVRALRARGARQVVWVTLREAGRGVIPSGALWQFDAYAWYFPYVNERLRRLDRVRDDLVLAEWDRVSKRTGVTYDAIHLNPRGAAPDGAHDPRRDRRPPPTLSARRRAAAGHRHGPLVVQPQEGDHVVGVLLRADRPRRPPRARQHVVRPHPPGLQQLVAQRAWGRGCRRAGRRARGPARAARAGTRPPRSCGPAPSRPATPSRPRRSAPRSPPSSSPCRPPIARGSVSEGSMQAQVSLKSSGAPPRRPL